MTLESWVAEISGKAEANGVSIFNSALRVHSADASLKARVLTRSRYTLLVQIAVVIRMALDLDTFDGWFSREPVWAQTKGAMVSSSANRLVSTLGLRAWILAFSSNAGHVVAAVGVSFASVDADISLTKLTGVTVTGVAFRSAGASLAGLTACTIVDRLAFRQTELFRIVTLTVAVTTLDGA